MTAFDSSTSDLSAGRITALELYLLPANNVHADSAAPVSNLPHATRGPLRMPGGLGLGLD